MSSEYSFEDKGKVNPKPSQEAENPQKDEGPITLADMKGPLDANKLTRMQNTLGNAAVQRFLAQRSGDGPSEIDEGTSQAINAERGGGQSLDEGIADKAGSVMGQDFSDVNVHTDGTADSLSQGLQAKAFTVGNDIFFKDGEYNPGSSDGQQLISHELTHVVQQGASAPNVQGKMTVNDPNDQYESEADSVAQSVMNSPDDEVSTKLESNIQRQMEDEAEDQAVKPGEDTPETQEVKPEEGMEDTQEVKPGEDQPEELGA
jgi:Domain of unknown function (DUF4157)